ncbi:RNA-directed DNA polymerase [Pseudoalteromonas sp. Cn5-37]|jgi:hypothetical protein|uniref:antiviral reverse transcriptase Drt3a n=1 Tax=Pseudoalteromonas sp. Cn5-37 TaxID=2908886 RepID=UPI001F17B418|nr:antiviral reverse transcriptase Drt3a [Pseudoalteromonas sp. Cn5-37]MCF2914594.1 RNA-directed DNA polymerase [Pseudoalteromonas sp. Cn5-37]
MELSFEKRNLRRSISYKNISNYAELDSESKREEIIQNSLEQLKSREIFINSIGIEYSNKKPIHLVKDVVSLPVINLLNENLQRAYSIKPKSRESILPVVINYLKETAPYSIFRFDIISFYESFERPSVLKKIKDDGLLSNETIKVLELLFLEFQKKQKGDPKIEFKGLPRGLNISATLSEIMFQDFDKKILENKDVFYYARYVDDIIIIAKSGKKAKEFQNEIKNLIPKPLKFHNTSNKQAALNIPKSSEDSNNKNIVLKFSFLGYEFTISDTTEIDKNCFSLPRRKIDIDISENKIDKIKERTRLTLIHFLKSHFPMGSEYQKMILRLKFLTSNYDLPIPNKGKTIKSGIRYNYRFITSDKSLKELDRYLSMLLFSKNSKTSRKLRNVLGIDNVRDLAHFSFSSGYNLKKHCKFTTEELDKIKEAWRK